MLKGTGRATPSSHWICPRCGAKRVTLATSPQHCGFCAGPMKKVG
jgi:ribosomal protein L37E